jgi:hypothetical protein
MIYLRLAGIATVALLLLLGTSTAQAAKNKALHTVHGTVVDVQRANGNAGGTVTVKVKRKNKGAATAVEVERKFRVTATTRTEFVQGKKGAPQHILATFGDVHNGELVVLVARGDHAEKIAIHRKGNK